METDNKKRNHSAIIAVVIIALSATAFVLYQARGAIYTELDNLKLIPTPERFTELYFENPATLPKQAVTGGLISFSFTIHNLEGFTVTYPYRIYFENPAGEKTVFATDAVTLADTATSTIKVTYRFPQLAAPMQKVGKPQPRPAPENVTGTIVVDLTSLNQQIDFLLPDTN